MNPFRRVALAFALLALPVPIAAATQPATDWSKVAERASDGAFVWGNPDARVRVVEYLSLTCPHCAHFEGEAIPPFTAKYIRPGLVNYEVRHALRDAYDYAGSLLVRCDGPQSFYSTLPRVFAQQDDWYGRVVAWAKVEQADGLPADQLLPKVARGAGFETLFGMTPAKLDACLANHDEQQLLTAQADEAWHRRDFPGTPAFMINDVLRSDIRTWADLDAAIATALHSRPSPASSVRKSPARKTARK